MDKTYQEAAIMALYMIGLYITHKIGGYDFAQVVLLWMIWLEVQGTKGNGGNRND